VGDVEIYPQKSVSLQKSVCGVSSGIEIFFSVSMVLKSFLLVAMVLKSLTLKNNIL
jgi:hypothetical protein